MLARTLKRCDEVPLDGTMARVAGQLCGWVGTSDMIDPSVAVVASSTDGPDDEILVLASDTADSQDLLSTVRTKPGSSGSDHPTHTFTLDDKPIARNEEFVESTGLR